MDGRDEWETRVVDLVHERLRAYHRWSLTKAVDDVTESVQWALMESLFEDLGVLQMSAVSKELHIKLPNGQRIRLDGRSGMIILEQISNLEVTSG